MAISDRIAVMNQGSVVQIDTAEALYARPCNAFMANFIGKSNLLPDKCCRPTRTAPRCACWARRCNASRPLRRCARATPSRSWYAPNRYRSRQAPARTPTARAPWRPGTFLGEKTEYHVQVGAATLHAVAYGAGPAARLAEGQAVQVRLPPEGSALIRD